MELWLTVIALAAGGTALGLSHWFSASRRRGRILGRTGPRRIADIRDGEVVKVVGRIFPLSAPVLAPLTGRQCVYFEANADHLRGQAGSWFSPRWFALVREHGGARFEIDDGSGRIEIDPDPAICLLEPGHRSFSSMGDPPTSVQRAFLDRHGKDGRDLLFPGSLRYGESVLSPGDEVAALGQVSRVGGRLRLAAGEGCRELLLSDRAEARGQGA